MRFRTKLLITSMARVIIPVVLAIGSYLAIARYLYYEQRVQELWGGVDYGMLSDPSEAFSNMADDVSREIALALLVNPFILKMRVFWSAWIRV